MRIFINADTIACFPFLTQPLAFRSPSIPLERIRSNIRMFLLSAIIKDIFHGFFVHFITKNNHGLKNYIFDMYMSVHDFAQIN